MGIMIAPSILSADFSILGKECLAMEKAGADMLHIDVMDGHFVPNISYGAVVQKSVRKLISIPFDTHLMISDPKKYVGDFIKAGSNGICFHLEAEGSPKETIEEIKAGGAYAGMALKPGTPAKDIFPYLPLLDMVLVMTVEPGFGGQSFMGDMCEKIGIIKDYARKIGKTILIQVDGGIDEKTAPIAVKAGADILVAGSALFSKDDYSTAVPALRSAAENI